jgi:hypothetical protein
MTSQAHEPYLINEFVDSKLINFNNSIFTSVSNVYPNSNSRVKNLIIDSILDCYF